MSHNSNTQILENYFESFQEAVEGGNWQLAVALLGDMKDDGFEIEAAALRTRLAAERAIDIAEHE